MITFKIAKYAREVSLRIGRSKVPLSKDKVPHFGHVASVNPRQISAEKSAVKLGSSPRLLHRSYVILVLYMSTPRLIHTYNWGSTQHVVYFYNYQKFRKSPDSKAYKATSHRRASYSVWVIGRWLLKLKRISAPTLRPHTGENYLNEPRASLILGPGVGTCGSKTFRYSISSPFSSPGIDNSFFHNSSQASHSFVFSCKTVGYSLTCHSVQILPYRTALA